MYDLRALAGMDVRDADLQRWTAPAAGQGTGYLTGPVKIIVGRSAPGAVTGTWSDGISPTRLSKRLGQGARVRKTSPVAFRL